MPIISKTIPVADNNFSRVGQVVFFASLLTSLRNFFMLVFAIIIHPLGIWQARQDLNLQHPVLETDALPIELRACDEFILLLCEGCAFYTWGNTCLLEAFLLIAFPYEQHNFWICILCTQGLQNSSYFLPFFHLLKNLVERGGFEPPKAIRQRIYSPPPLATRAPLRLWSQRRDSNPRPTNYKSVALPTELRWRPLRIVQHNNSSCQASNKVLYL